MEEKGIKEMDEVISALEVILYAMKWQKENKDNFYAHEHIVKDYETTIRKLKTWRINYLGCLEE